MIGDMFLRNMRQKVLLKQRTEEAVKKLQVGRSFQSIVWNLSICSSLLGVCYMQIELNSIFQSSACLNLAVILASNTIIPFNYTPFHHKTQLRSPSVTGLQLEVLICTQWHLGNSNLLSLALKITLF